MTFPKIKRVEWPQNKESRRVQNFLQRPSVPQAAEDAAREVLAEIKKEGDKAVLRFARKFDESDLDAEGLSVSAREIADSHREVDDEFKQGAQESLKRVMAFAEKGLNKDWSFQTPKGGSVGEMFHPLQRVGVYIPGGTAPLVSTALMTVPIAKTAGVDEIAACTPAGADGEVNPYILYALDIAGATEIYRIGGIQAVGALAYGTETIAKVQKIVGPGGPYVTAAKRQVYGDVGLDMVAGPSEIAVLADASANPSHVAADLLSQAEHGSGHEKVLLVTTSRKLADEVEDELKKQTATLSKANSVLEVLKNGSLIALANSIGAGIELCNLFAPEHMELIVREPRSWINRIHSAGAVFLGPWTPESAGDFIAGPSHVLPTGGTAKIFSGLTVADFQRRTSVIEFTREELEDTRQAIEAFGRVETLDAHARSASIRFES